MTLAESDTSLPNRPANQRPRTVIQLTIVCAILIVLPIAAVGVTYVAAARRNTELQNMPVLGRLPDFHLIERSGKPITLADLKDRIWIADFIFTYCAGPCPRMTATFSELQKALKDQHTVRLVTFTVDPDRDTPNVLRDYADQHGADPNKWLFVTGKRAAIHRLVTAGFKLGSVENPMMHSTRFVLVDGDKIRGYYDSEEPESVDSLLKDALLLSTGH